MHELAQDSLQSPVAALDGQASATLDWAQQKQEVQWAFQGHGFELGNLGVLIEPELRCEVVNGLQICSIPGTARWLLGMSQLRGRVLPVFDLRELFFGEATKNTSALPILVIEAQAKSLAFLLPGMPRRIELTEQQAIESQSGVPEIIKPYCRKLFYQDRLWVNFDYDSFFLHMREKLVIAH